MRVKVSVLCQVTFKNQWGRVVNTRAYFNTGFYVKNNIQRVSFADYIIKSQRVINLNLVLKVWYVQTNQCVISTMHYRLNRKSMREADTKQRHKHPRPNFVYGFTFFLKLMFFLNFILISNAQLRHLSGKKTLKYITVFVF
jgi:hypothetical protein